MVSTVTVETPERVRTGEPHQVTVLIKNRTRTAARISLFRDGAPIGVQNGILEAGENSVEVTSILPIIEKLLEEGKTVVMVEHRLKELFRIANKVVVFNYGKKLTEGPPKEILENEEVKRAYLGVEV